MGRLSFDVVGKIALVDEKAMEVHSLRQEDVASALLSTLPIKSVYMVGKVTGEFRTPHLTWLGGERITRTVHKESGCTFVVDVKDAYFNPRLS
ncbi:MAG: class I SAM-dependent methyltransferase, partial [Methermicoccaceae archaeon]